jgi:hypothetical protein
MKATLIEFRKKIIFEGMERGPRARLLYSPDFPPPVELIGKSNENNRT